ncbi:MAG: hypothetical protein KBA46_01925 [Candidatus Omnitrophica bacterium]|nr:hypothetical protein [Candidatus Omnitrophota bacterium]
MAKKPIFRVIMAVGMILFTQASLCLAQTNEEQQDERLRSSQLQQKPPAYKTSASAGVFVGFDSNVNLTPTRKGDVFEEALFAFTLLAKAPGNSKFTLNYHFDSLMYNEITDASLILNHLRLTISKSMLRSLEFGTGYDLGVFTYPYADSENFLFSQSLCLLSLLLCQEGLSAIGV